MAGEWVTAVTGAAVCGPALTWTPPPEPEAAAAGAGAVHNGPPSAALAVPEPANAVTASAVTASRSVRERGSGGIVSSVPSDPDATKYGLWAGPVTVRA